MPTRVATARWAGSIQEGAGTMALGSGAFEGAYSFRTRMGDAPGTNPEELLGAAHAGCFSMALSAGLTRAGTPPASLETTARVHFEQQDEGWRITRIDLSVEGAVAGIDEDAFRAAADDAKANCPVSIALAGVPEVTLETTWTAPQAEG
jgi:osmotically inducible protein OsmC